MQNPRLKIQPHDLRPIRASNFHPFQVLGEFERAMTPKGLKKDANSLHLVVRFGPSAGTLFFNRMAMKLLEGGISTRPKAIWLLKLMEEIKDANSY